MMRIRDREIAKISQVKNPQYFPTSRIPYVSAWKEKPKRFTVPYSVEVLDKTIYAKCSSLF